MQQFISFILQKLRKLVKGPSVFSRQNVDSGIEIVVDPSTLESSGSVSHHVEKTVGKVVLLPVVRPFSGLLIHPEELVLKHRTLNYLDGSESLKLNSPRTELSGTN